jgi:hypothetical protein
MKNPFQVDKAVKKKILKGSLRKQSKVIQFPHKSRNIPSSLSLHMNKMNLFVATGWDGVRNQSKGHTL